MAEAYPEHGSPSRYTIERGRRRKETVLVDNVENQIWHRNGKKGKLVFRCLKKPSLHCKATLKYRNGRYVRTGNGHNHDSLELEISTNRMLHFGHNLAQTSSTPVGEIIRLSFERWKFSILVCKEFICVIKKFYQVPWCHWWHRRCFVPQKHQQGTQGSTTRPPS